MKNDRFTGNINFLDVYNADQAFYPPDQEGVAQCGDRIELENGITVDIVVKSAAPIAVAPGDESPVVTASMQGNSS